MRGWRPRALLALAVAAALMVGLSFPLFVFPATDEPGRADAVVVFAGAGGDRQSEGVRLVREGVAPVLVVSDGGQAGSPGARLCRRRPAGLRLHCLTPARPPPGARHGRSPSWPGGRAGARWSW